MLEARLGSKREYGKKVCRSGEDKSLEPMVTSKTHGVRGGFLGGHDDYVRDDTYYIIFKSTAISDLAKRDSGSVFNLILS